MDSGMVNLYEALGLPPNCTGVEIRRSIVRHQKDGSLNDEQINFVKMHLLNPSNRAKYDAELGVTKASEPVGDDSGNQSNMVNLYDLLGLPVDATENQIRQHIMQHHAAETLDAKYLKAARDWLLNSDVRQKYNEKLRASYPYLFAANDSSHNGLSLESQGNEENNIYRNPNKIGIGNNKPVEVDTKTTIITGAVIFFVLFLIVKSCSSSGGASKSNSPEMTEIKMNRLGRESISKVLKDPDSAKFRNEISICGEVNSKNGFGAYTGFTRYIGAGDGMSLLDDGSSTFNEAWSQVCTK